MDIWLTVVLFFFFVSMVFLVYMIYMSRKRIHKLEYENEMLKAGIEADRLRVPMVRHKSDGRYHEDMEQDPPMLSHKKSDGLYHIDGGVFEEVVGRKRAGESRKRVWQGTAYMTPGGLTKKDLRMHPKTKRITSVFTESDSE